MESDASSETLRDVESLIEPDEVRLRERTLVWEPESDGL